MRATVGWPGRIDRVDRKEASTALARDDLDCDAAMHDPCRNTRRVRPSKPEARLPAPLRSHLGAAADAAQEGGQAGAGAPEFDVADGVLGVASGDGRGIAAACGLRRGVPVFQESARGREVWFQQVAGAPDFGAGAAVASEALHGARRRPGRYAGDAGQPGAWRCGRGPGADR